MTPEYELNEEAWEEFCEHRQTLSAKSRKSWSLLAQKKAKKLLQKLPPEQQQECVDASIVGGWQGLFPDRFRPTNNMRKYNDRPKTASEQYAEWQQRQYDQLYGAVDASRQDPDGSIRGEVVGRSEDREAGRGEDGALDARPIRLTTH